MKRVLMDISADLTRIALAEDGELKELYYESKREESLVGNVYAGDRWWQNRGIRDFPQGRICIMGFIGMGSC